MGNSGSAVDDKKDPRDPEFIEKIRRKVIWFCRTRSAIPADDLFQEVYLRFLEGKNDHSTIEQACIDVYRAMFGRISQKGRFRESRVKLINAVSFDEIDAARWYSNEWQEKINLRLDAEKAINSVYDKKLKGILMKHAEGFTNEEIASEIGVTQARVHQIIDRADIPQEQQPEDLIGVAKLSETLNYNYVQLCKHFQSDKIPFVKKRGKAGRYVTRDTMNKLIALKQRVGDNWPILLHEVFPQKEMAPAIPSLTQTPVVKSSDDIKAKLLRKARQLNIDKKFEASSEFFMFINDNF